MIALGLACLAGLVVGSCFGLLVTGLLWAARNNEECDGPGNVGPVAVVAGDGGDAVGDHSAGV